MVCCIAAPHKPKPSHMLRKPTDLARLSTVRPSFHAVLRSEERCGITQDELDVALTEWSVPLRFKFTGDRTCHLFFLRGAGTFFVGIVARASSQPTLVTVLEKTQFENSYGPLPADALRTAAYRALPAADFERWASSF